MRGLALSVEVVVGVANVVAFGALLAHGSRAGRIAWRAMTWGGAAALVAALATLLMRTDDAWLMDAWRTEPGPQLVKALIVLGLLVSAEITRRYGDEWSTSRAAEPFFRLVCVAGLVAAASAADLLLLWIALDIATAALVLMVASVGRWSTREKTVRRMLAVWLPSSLVMLLGVILLAATGGSTRYEVLANTLPGLRDSLAVMLGMLLVTGSILARSLRLVALLGLTRRS